MDNESDVSRRADWPAWHYRIDMEGGRPRLTLGSGLGHLRLVANGAPAGHLIGFPTDLIAHRLPADDVHDLGRGQDLLKAIDRTFGGCWLAVIRTNAGWMIYPDATAQIPCTYDPAVRVAGVSADAVLDGDTYDARLDRSRFKRLTIDQRGWVPGGFTTHDGVYRLLPNHALDLTTFQPRRAWGADPIEEQGEAQGLDIISQQIAANLEALLSGHGRLQLALTAGRDSRAVLAHLRDQKDKVCLVTVGHTIDRSIDARVAARIASDIGLPHRVFQRQEATAEQREAYLRRNGHCVADENARAFPTMAQFDPTVPFVGGVGFEAGRGTLWRPSDRADTRLTPQGLLRRLGLPSDPDVEAALEAWLDPLAHLSAFQILDLAYIEQRAGPWASAQFPADPSVVRYAPIVTRRSIEAILALPPDFRRRGALNEALIARHWPDLLKLPFNSEGPAKDLWRRVQRVASDPGAALSKLRKLS